MIRWLCDFFGHAVLRLAAPENQVNVRCLCGLTDYIVPQEFLE